MDRNAPMTIPPEPPHDVACSQGKNRCSAIVWQIFRERYPKQVLYFVKVNTNGKLETRTKGIVDKCSDLTCTKKYALTKGPKRIDRFTFVSRLFPFCPFSLFGWGLNCYWLLLCGCHFLGLVIANTFACFSV